MKYVRCLAHGVAIPLPITLLPRGQHYRRRPPPVAPGFVRDLETLSRRAGQLITALAR